MKTQQLSLLDWIHEPQDTQGHKTVSIETIKKIILPKMYPYEPKDSKTFCTFCHQMTDGKPCEEERCPN